MTSTTMPERRTFGGLILGCAIGVTLGMTASLMATTTVTISDTNVTHTPGGSSGTGDTSILRNLPADYSNFAHDFVGSYSGGAGDGQTRRTLLRFDVSSLAGLYSQINSITLNVFPAGFDDGSNGGNTTFTNTLQVLQVASANAGWSESSSAGASAVTGETSWLFKVHSNSNPAGPYTGTAWAGSAGLSTSGTDYDATALASATYGTGTVINTSSSPLGGGLSFSGSSAALTSLINAWMNPSTNAGLLLTAVNEATGADEIIWLNSNEVSNTALRPELVINYTPFETPEPATLGLVAIGGLALFRRRRQTGR